MRNLVLNWLVIIPVVCIALLLLKLIATGSVLIAHSGNDSLVFGAGFHHHAPSGMALAIVFSSRSFALHFGKDWTSLPVIDQLSLSDLSNPVDLIWVTAIVAP